MMRLTRRSLLSAMPALGFAGQALAQQPIAPTGTRIVPQQTERDMDYTLDAWVDAFGRPTAKVMINGAGLLPCADWDLSTRGGIPRAYRLSVSEAGGSRTESSR